MKKANELNVNIKDKNAIIIWKSCLKVFPSAYSTISGYEKICTLRAAWESLTALIVSMVHMMISVTGLNAQPPCLNPIGIMNIYNVVYPFIMAK